MNTSPGKWPFGAQVAAGFFLPPALLAVACAGAALGSAAPGPLRRFASFVCSAVVVALLIGGVALAARKGWKGMLLGFALSAALGALLIGWCFAVMFSLFPQR